MKTAIFRPFGGPIKRFFLILSCLGLSFLTACANVIPACNAKTSPPSTEFRNTKWELVRWNLAPNARGEVRAIQDAIALLLALLKMPEALRWIK
jgi:hypothetical protein